MVHRRITIRKLRQLWLSAGLALLVVLSMTSGPAAVAAGEIAVEGEAATATNYSPGAANDARMSGGQYLRLWAAVTSPATEYTARYDVTVPETGLYQLDVASTPPTGVSWASPYQIKVNNGAFSTAQGVKFGQVTPEVWQLHLSTVYLTAGTNSITFRVNESRPSGGQYVMYIDSLSLTPAGLQAAAITGDSPLNVFEANHPARFEALLNAPAPEATHLSYVVQDYWSTTIRQGSVPVPGGAVSVAFDIGTLPIGHYLVSVQPTGGVATTTNMAVVLEDAARTKPADSPFAMDVAGAWRVPADKWDAYARALDLSGVSWIRDRITWSTVNNPTSGSFNFPSVAGTEGFTKAMAGTGIKILENINSAPTWTRQSGKQLPNKLDAVYDFAKQSGVYYNDRGVRAWELLNESNAGSWTAPTETADQYAAALKAAAIGYEDSGVNPLVSAVGLAGREPNPWVDLMLRNGVLDYADIYNYHLHQLYNPEIQPTPFPTGVPAYLSLMDQYDPGDTQAWMTEAGLKIAGSSGRPMTAEEQRAQARYQVTWAVTAIAQGTDKHFVFLGPPYDEGTGQYGLFEPSTFTPYAGYTAEAAMTAALGEGRYRGTVPGLPVGVTGHVFGDGDDSVLVMWSTSNRALTVDLEQSTGTVTNVVGSHSTVQRSANGFTVNVSPDPIYLRVNGDVPVDTSAAPEPTPTPVETTFGTGDRVVLMQNFPAAVSGNAREGGYALPIDKPTTMTLDVYNFNDAAVTGTITGTAADGWAIADRTRNVTIPAHGKTTLEFQISATANVQLNKKSPITFRGEIQGDSISQSTTLITTSQDRVAVRHAYTADGTDALRVAVKNNTGSDLRPELIRWTAGTKRGAVNVNGTIPAGATREFEVPLPTLDTGSHRYVVDIHFRGGSIFSYHGSVAVIDPANLTDFAQQGITVDGVPDDLSGVPTVDLVEDGKVNIGSWSGPADLSGKFAVTWDDQNLYISGQFTDDVFTQPYTGANTWQGDSIQFSVAPGLPSESRTWEEYDLALTGNGDTGQLYRRRGTGVPVGIVTTARVAGKRDDATRTTVYELSLPWSEVPSIRPTDGLMSFSLLVNDNDGAGRETYIEWGSGIANTKDPSQFNPVWLSPAT